MITLIGTSTTIVGFGLCGIKDVHEVRNSTSDEVLASLINKANGKIIMIDESLYDRVKEKIEVDKTFIKIPSRFKDSENVEDDDIDELVKDTIGVAIKN